jgi:hypothetical protein
MFHPAVADDLRLLGQDAISPQGMGNPNQTDAELIRIATDDGLIIVTENMRHFAGVSTCAVVLVRRSWWPNGTVRHRLVGALAKWAAVNPEPGNCARWLDAEFR